MNERLLALATAQARTNHLEDSDADGFGCRDGHSDQFNNCPHENCAAVRVGAARPPQPEWRSIESAPADTGRDWVLVCVHEDCMGPSAPTVVPAYRRDGLWHLAAGFALADQSPTRWMPLPAAAALPLLGAWRDRERKEE